MFTNKFSLLMQKEKDKGRAEGVQIGEARGEARGFLNALFSCVADGLLPIAAAAAKANMTEDEFRARMQDHPA